jgi:hypothetical protein
MGVRGGGGCSVAERDIPFEVPELEYVAVESWWLDRLRSHWDGWWGEETPIDTCVRCVRCGRYTEDFNRDGFGDPVHRDPADDRENVCSDCAGTAFIEGLKATIDEQIDFSDEDRAALKKVVELVVHEPDKVLELKDLGNKVRGLEKQNNFFRWVLGIEGGLIAVLIASVIALALAS